MSGRFLSPRIHDNVSGRTMSLLWSKCRSKGHVTGPGIDSALHDLCGERQNSKVEESDDSCTSSDSEVKMRMNSSGDSSVLKSGDQ